MTRTDYDPERVSQTARECHRALRALDDMRLPVSVDLEIQRARKALATLDDLAASDQGHCEGMQ